MIAVVLELSGIPSLAFAVGVYLPLSSTSPIFVGGLLRGLVDWYVRRKNAGQKLSEEELTAEGDKSPGVLLASGYIAGGAIAGIVIAFMAGVLSNTNRSLEHWAAAHNPFFEGEYSDLLSMIPFVLIGRRALGRRTRAVAQAGQLGQAVTELVHLLRCTIDNRKRLFRFAASGALEAVSPGLSPGTPRLLRRLAVSGSPSSVPAAHLRCTSSQALSWKWSALHTTLRGHVDIEGPRTPVSYLARERNFAAGHRALHWLRRFGAAAGRGRSRRGADSRRECAQRDGQ